VTDTTVVLVRAPLVGPSTWRPVAEELQGRGVNAVVARLPIDSSSESRGPLFDRLVEAGAEVVPSGKVILVGHSGAGFLLPFIGEAAAASTATCYVFVDAGLPPTEGRVELAGEQFRSSLEERAADGVLPPWDRWWGEQGMRALVPDHAVRESLSADMPCLPLSYFDATPVVPVGWAERSAGYVLFSEIYRVWAQQAADLGWPVVEVPGTHLELVNRPSDVAAAILTAAGQT